MQYTKGDSPTWYSDSSSQRLGTCDGRLQMIFHELANQGWDITIFCGHRGEDEQDEAKRLGDSKASWPYSKHNSVPSKAVDAGPYIAGVGTPGYNNVDDNDAIWAIFAGAVLSKAQENGLQLRWGAFITGLKDLAHFEIID